MIVVSYGVECTHVRIEAQGISWTKKRSMLFVAAVLDDLPEEFAELLNNIEVIVEPQPRAEHRRAVRIKPWQTCMVYTRRAAHAAQA
jgi:hypothetical protein